jgi:hypothetical protein
MATPEDSPADRPVSARRSRPSSRIPRKRKEEALVIVTLRASNGSIVKIEGMEPGGERHQMSAAEAAQLLGDRTKSTVEGLVHEAFEAGLACVLDDRPNGASDEASGESQEYAALHDDLLDDLIEHSPAKRLLSRDVLHGAVLRTIISEAAAAAPPAAE